MNESAFATRYVQKATRKECPVRVEKLLDDTWTPMSHWPGNPDEAKLQRHASALGGQVRLMRNGVRAREWWCGQEVFP